MPDIYDKGGLQAMEAMFAFLNLEPTCEYTAGDRDALYRDLDSIAALCAQKDAGQRGRGISFTELPFINARIAANAMRLRMSGLLDGLDGE